MKLVLAVYIDDVPEGYASADVARVLQQMIEVGQADAVATNEEPDLCSEDSNLAAQLEIKVSQGPLSL